MPALRLLLAALLGLLCATSPGLAAELRIGSWKTAQTIQPWFLQEHLDAADTVRVFAFTNPADQKTALLAGSLDMTGTTLAHAIQSAAMGQPVVVVAALCDRCSALVVAKDGPVQRVADLKGRRVGYVPGTMHEILLREALLREGLSPERDITLVRIDFFDMGTALAKGSIDAFLSGEPLPSLALDQGYGRILAYPYYGDSVGTINAGLLVTREMIARQPETVQRLVTAHARATEALRRDRGRWLDRAEAFGTPRPVLDLAAANMELTWRMDQPFISKVKALGERMQLLGLIKQQPNYERLIDPRFVEQAARSLSP